MNIKKLALMALAPAAMALGIAMYSSPSAQAAEMSSLGSSGSSVMGSLGSSGREPCPIFNKVSSEVKNVVENVENAVNQAESSVEKWEPLPNSIYDAQGVGMAFDAPPIVLPTPENKPAPKPNPAPAPKPAPKPNPAPATPNIEQMKTEVHNQTNALRAKHGAKPLTYNRVVAQDSQRWADQMARTGNFNHDPALKTDYKYVYAENIYKVGGGQVTASRMVDAWYNSPGHRNNMLNPEWNLTGVGISRSGNEWYAVARFTSTDRFINYHPRPGF